MGDSWGKPNTDSEPVKSKWLAKGNPEEMPHKSNSNCHEGATQRLSLQVLSGVYPHVLYFSPLINTLLVSLLSIFVGIILCKAEEPGPCHWSLVYG